MIKTQIQIPDYLHQEAKRIAREYEMSLAEVVRRGLETITKEYPPRKSKIWIPPTPRKLGINNTLTPEKLSELAKSTHSNDLV